MSRGLFSLRIISLRQNIEQTIRIPRLIVQCRGSLNEHRQVIIFFEPVSHHIHSGNSTRSRPNIPINDPFLLSCPIDLWPAVLDPIKFDVVDSSCLPVQNTRGCDKTSTCAACKEQLAGSDMFTYEVGMLRMQVEVTEVR